MAKEYEWNPHRGTWYEYEDTSDGGVVIKTMQDVQPAIDWAKKQRNSGVNDLGGAKDGGDMKYYACLPAHIELELRQKGIDIYSHEATNRLIYEIETNYPQCKVTNRKMRGSRT